MPRADYRCPVCGMVWEDVVFSSVVGARVAAPACPNHPTGTLIVMEWIPACGFDLKTDGEGGRGFQKFTVHRQVPSREGLVQVEETVDSLHKLRKIEADSEQRYKNGEGEPLRFRGYAQDASNMDTNSFGHAGTIGGRAYDDGQQPRKKMPVTRHGSKKPNTKVARGGGVSPLKG